MLWKQYEATGQDKVREVVKKGIKVAMICRKRKAETEAKVFAFIGFLLSAEFSIKSVALAGLSWRELDWHWYRSLFTSIA